MTTQSNFLVRAASSPSLDSLVDIMMSAMEKGGFQFDTSFARKHGDTYQIGLQKNGGGNLESAAFLRQLNSSGVFETVKTRDKKYGLNDNSGSYPLKGIGLTMMIYVSNDVVNFRLEKYKWHL